MALSSTLTLKNNALADKVFTENKRNGYRAERLREDTSLQMPALMVIDHSTTNGNGIASNRHLIQVAVTESDGNGGKAVTVVNLTISIPSNAPSSAAAKDAVATIANLLLTAGATNATFDDVLQNQS